MHDILLGMTAACKTCLRKGAQCRTCWTSEAVNVINDMNTPEPTLELAKMKNIDNEVEQVLELVNAHLGISVKMLASSFEMMNINQIQHIVRKLLKQKKIASSNGCPRVYFPAATPVDAIQSISQTFTKTRKAKHGNS